MLVFWNNGGLRGRCLIWRYDFSLLVNQEGLQLLASPIKGGDPYNSCNRLILWDTDKGRRAFYEKDDFNDKLWLGRFELHQIVSAYEHARNVTTIVPVSFALDIAQSLELGATQDAMIVSYVGDRMQAVATTAFPSRLR